MRTGMLKNSKKWKCNKRSRQCITKQKVLKGPLLRSRPVMHVAKIPTRIVRTVFRDYHEKPPSIIA